MKDQVILGYSARNGKFKRLEPHFQVSATRSRWKEVTETAVDSPQSRECTKEPISPLRILDHWKSSELEQDDGISDVQN